MSPDIEQVTYAIARKFKWRIQPSGNTALNYLGLSTQVSAHYQYISDGPDRSYRIDNLQLDFKHTAIKEEDSNTNKALGIHTINYMEKFVLTKELVTDFLR